MANHPLSMAARYVLGCMVAAEQDIGEEEARYGVGSTKEDLMAMLECTHGQITPVLDELHHYGMLVIRYEVAGAAAEVARHD